MKTRLILLLSARLVEAHVSILHAGEMGQSKEVLLLLQSYHRANVRLIIISSVVFLFFLHSHDDGQPGLACAPVYSPPCYGEVGGCETRTSERQLREMQLMIPDMSQLLLLSASYARAR